MDNGCSTATKAGKIMMSKAPRKNGKEPKDSELDSGRSTVAKAGKKLMLKAQGRRVRRIQKSGD